jgi:hypothetical protein
MPLNAFAQNTSNSAISIFGGRSAAPWSRACCRGSGRRAAPPQVGTSHAHKSDPADRTSLQDVFFRIDPGKATTSLIVNSDNVLLDDIRAWRADHGNGVGWTANSADTGVIVNGDDVTAYGLFVEHYQKDEVISNGQNGRVGFFQNEMPYDPPSQAAWLEAPGVLVDVGDAGERIEGIEDCFFAEATPEAVAEKLARSLDAAGRVDPRGAVTEQAWGGLPSGSRMSTRRPSRLPPRGPEP